MNKNSDFFERILQITEYYKIKNVNSFAKDWLNYSSPEKIYRLKEENKSPSYEILQNISNKFENINMNWLLTGKGNMLLDGSVIEPKEPIQQQKEVVVAECEKCKEKERVIISQQKTICLLEDKIESLENVEGFSQKKAG